jgi:dCMP deaminase
MTSSLPTPSSIGGTITVSVLAPRPAGRYVESTSPQHRLFAASGGGFVSIAHRINEYQRTTDWDHYFLNIARETATRSNCTRRQHGAVIVRKRRICSTGYNGPPSGHPHCDEGACPRANSETPSGWGYDSCIAIHAEANAILYSSPEEREGASIYITGVPCFTCAKLIANSGISEVISNGEPYDGWNDVRTFLLNCAIRVRLIS